MKPALFLAIVGFSLFSCKKSDLDRQPLSPLEGTWRMVVVTDNASGQMVIKLPNVPGDVNISIRSVNSNGGIYSGNTPTNNIWENDFSVAPNQKITMPVLAMTKVGETDWGALFVNNIRSSTDYNFASNDLLNILTPAKTLTFKRL